MRDPQLDSSQGVGLDQIDEVPADSPRRQLLATRAPHRDHDGRTLAPVFDRVVEKILENLDELVALAGDLERGELLLGLLHVRLELLRLAHELSEIGFIHGAILTHGLDRIRLQHGTEALAQGLHGGIAFERGARLFQPLVASLLLAARGRVPGPALLDLDRRRIAAQPSERVGEALFDLARMQRGGALVPLSRAQDFAPGATTTENARQYRTRDVELTPAGRDKADAFQTYDPQHNPRMRCETTSILFDWTYDGAVNRITQTADTVTLEYGQFGFKRTIHLNMTEHPADLEPSRAGHSIGRWEGDALVVDTVGFTTDTFLGNQGMRHSDKMHIVERFRLASPDRLEVQTTVSDPEALTKPLTRTAAYGRHRDWTLAEYVCQQNNRNFTTDDGKAGIDLSFEESP